MAVLAFSLAATPVRAQNSIFGVNGIGFPGRHLSVRSRALGGGSGLFDALSQLNPAAVSSYSRLTAMATTGTDFRGYDIGGVTVDGLRETRFPIGSVGARIARTRWAFSIGYSAYAERSFNIMSSDSITLRGQRLAVLDELGSDGGITDIRGALAYSFSRKFALGGALHLISGSSKTTAGRQFDNPDYVSFEQKGDLSFSGYGFSAGFVFAPGPKLSIAGAWRIDSELDTEFDSLQVASVDLPVGLSAGVVWHPALALRWSTTVTYRGWSSAEGDFDVRTNAFDTWEIGTGVQLGGPESGASRIPLRLGFRWAQLPFSATGDQPREFNLSVGTGLPFANNRALLDISLERIIRDGSGVSERAWYLSFGFAVSP